MKFHIRGLFCLPLKLLKNYINDPAEQASRSTKAWAKPQIDHRNQFFFSAYKILQYMVVTNIFDEDVMEIF